MTAQPDKKSAKDLVAKYHGAKLLTNRPSVKDYFDKVLDEDKEALLDQLIPFDIEYAHDNKIAIAAEDYEPLGEYAIKIAKREIGRFGLPYQTIDNYKLEKPLGEGGMGSVFLAHDKKVGRKAAIKLAQLGHISAIQRRKILRRFVLERETLARFNHPNIAKVYGAGETDDGLPYLAMEFVDGEKITDYCDRKGLGIRERIRLFVQVCDAVAHAHARNILHRDLSPDNILVTDFEGCLLYTSPSPRD